MFESHTLYDLFVHFSFKCSKSLERLRDRVEQYCWKILWHEFGGEVLKHICVIIRLQDTLFIYVENCNNKKD